MKPYTLPAEKRAEVRAWIAEHWGSEPDARIAERFALSRAYVVKLRQRMRLRKDVEIMAFMREERRGEARTVSRVSRAMSDNRKLRRALIRQGVIQVESDEPLSTDERSAFMRSRGYGVS